MVSHPGEPARCKGARPRTMELVAGGCRGDRGNGPLPHRHIGSLEERSPEVFLRHLVDSRCCPKPSLVRELEDQRVPEMFRLETTVVQGGSVGLCYTQLPGHPRAIVGHVGVVNLSFPRKSGYKGLNIVRDWYSLCGAGLQGFWVSVTLPSLPWL